MDKYFAITMGDPAGIGPEITAKLINGDARKSCVILGDLATMAAAFHLIGAPQKIAVIENIEQFDPARVNLIQTSGIPLEFTTGQVSPAAGQAAVDAILAAITMAISGDISGIITAPIHKESLVLAGYTYPGHTEILSHMTESKVAMMLVNDTIRTVLVTIHMSLSDAITAGDFNAQCDAIHLAHSGAERLGIKNPRVAVAGLNPHAGENGRFGREEIDIISPAIASCQAQGIDVSGPWPGDTVFMRAREGQFDVVVAQYHDQGLIPVKYLGLEKGVNITLGLPFVRTSPDHGTAFDIAGKGIADVRSMQAALDMARQLITARG